MVTASGMELAIKHYNPDDESTIILSVLCDVSEHEATPWFDQFAMTLGTLMELEAGETAENQLDVGFDVDMTDFWDQVADLQYYWDYEGSLTSPPCTEKVIHIVSGSSCIMSKEFDAAIGGFDSMVMSARDAQPLYGRMIYNQTQWEPPRKRKPPLDSRVIYCFIIIFCLIAFCCIFVFCARAVEQSGVEPFIEILATCFFVTKKKCLIPCWACMKHAMYMEDDNHNSRSKKERLMFNNYDNTHGYRRNNTDYIQPRGPLMYKTRSTRSDEEGKKGSLTISEIDQMLQGVENDTEDYYNSERQRIPDPQGYVFLNEEQNINKHNVDRFHNFDRYNNFHPNKQQNFNNNNNHWGRDYNSRSSSARVHNNNNNRPNNHNNFPN
eukprot:UN32879